MRVGPDGLIPGRFVGLDSLKLGDFLSGCREVVGGPRDPGPVLGGPRDGGFSDF